MKERKRRGFLMLAVGIVLMLTFFLGMDHVFVWCGLVFALLGCGDIFFDSRYKRRF